MQYLVIATEGPSFGSPEEALQLLENVILPTFGAMIELKSSGKILAGGLPVGGRSFALIAEADSNDELDSMLREIPVWPHLDWEVTPLQSIEGRAAYERKFIDNLK